MPIDKDDERKYKWAFGERLRKVREKTGMNKGNAAKACKVDQGAFSRYENGDSLPSIYQMKKIVEVLGGTLDYLILGIEK